MQQKTEVGSCSLILKKDDKVIFSSKEHGLKPLVECVSKFKGKIEGGILFDIVVGLAAARLIVYSGMIDKVDAGTISDSAFDYLTNKGIGATYNNRVKAILNRDKTGQCPMELMSSKFEEDEKFFAALSGCIRE